MNRGDVVEGVAERLLPGGEALVRAPEGVNALVADAVPGDRLRIRLTGRRRGARRGEIESITAPSPDRVAPPCPVAGRCGGCALQYVAPEHQARIKSAWVRDAFAPFSEEGAAWRPVDPNARSAPRRRLRYHRAVDEAGAHLGFRRRTGHAVVRHAHCMVAHPAANALRGAVEADLPDSVAALGITVLADGMHAVLEGEQSSPPAGLSLPPAAGELPVVWWWRRGRRIVPIDTPQPLHDELPAGEGTMSLRVGPADFVQGQAPGNAAMVDQVRVWAGSPRLAVDLFAGVGNLSLPLAAATGCRVLGAEVRSGSVAAANANARRLGLDAAYVVEDLLAGVDTERYAGADLLILDPPRRGARRVCAALGTLLPERVVLVSCDPAAGRRDAGALAAAGYRLRALRALDLFPYAGHVEAMSLWGR